MLSDVDRQDRGARWPARSTLKAEGKLTSYTLPAGIPIFRRSATAMQEYANVPVMIGDRAGDPDEREARPVAAIVHGELRRRLVRPHVQLRRTGRAATAPTSW